MLDINGEPIQLVTDKITADERGDLFLENGGFLGRIGVYAFADMAQVEKNAQGLFTSDAQPQLVDARVIQGMTERSNVDLAQQMAEMIATQRAYQSVAEVTKIYDQLMNRATTEVGRL